MTEQLAQLIIANNLTAEANAALISGDWSPVRTPLNAETVERKDTTLRATTWLSTVFTDPVAGKPGWIEADVILKSMNDPKYPPRIKAAADTMTNREKGIDLSNSDVQAGIDLMSATDAWPAGLATRLKECGFKMISPCEDKGLPAATDQAVEDAWTAKQISDRITNATALAEERILPSMTGTERAAAWAQAWEDAV